MAFWRKPKKEIEAGEPQEVSSLRVGEITSAEKVVPSSRVPAKGGYSRHGVLRWPHITEKASAAGKMNQYVFVVDPHANKIEVARAVAARYGVIVGAVRVITTLGKIHRRGRIKGRRPGHKKAIVTLKEGQTIEIQ